MGLDDQVLEEIVSRIVAVAQPEKIILFGSAARVGIANARDLDLLVVKRGDYHHISEAQLICRALRHIKFAKDVIVITPEELDRYKDDPALVIYPAVREGRVVFERRAA